MIEDCNYVKDQCSFALAKLLLFADNDYKDVAIQVAEVVLVKRSLYELQIAV